MKKTLFAFALMALSGCGLFWDDPYIDVQENPLNWVEIHYYNAQFEPIRRMSVRITGDGFVEVKSGTSKLISDSFAKDNKAESWEDITEHRLRIDPAHVADLFQELVNHDLFDKDKMGKSTKKPSPGRFIAVRAGIDNRMYSEPKNQFEEDPELAEILYNIMLEFRRVKLGKAAQ